MMPMVTCMRMMSHQRLPKPRFEIRAEQNADGGVAVSKSDGDDYDDDDDDEEDCDADVEGVACGKICGKTEYFLIPKNPKSDAS